MAISLCLFKRFVFEVKRLTTTSREKHGPLYFISYKIICSFTSGYIISTIGYDLIVRSHRTTRLIVMVVVGERSCT